MAVEVATFTSEESFIEKCIEAMQSKDALQRISARLSRDMLPVLQREMRDCRGGAQEPADVVYAAARVASMQLVMLISSFAKPGMEQSMIETFTEVIRDDTAQALKIMTAHPGPAAKRAEA